MSETIDSTTPTTKTALVVLGSLQFEPSGDSTVLAVKIATPDDLQSKLQAAKELAPPNSLETLHVVLRASSIPLIYDDTILTTFSDSLIRDTNSPDDDSDEEDGGSAQIIIHVIANHPTMPVQAGDVDILRISLVSAGFRLESEQTSGEDGGWMITARA